MHFATLQNSKTANKCGKPARRLKSQTVIIIITIIIVNCLLIIKSLISRIPRIIITIPIRKRGSSRRRSTVNVTSDWQRMLGDWWTVKIPYPFVEELLPPRMLTFFFSSYIQWCPCPSQYVPRVCYDQTWRNHAAYYRAECRISRSSVVHHTRISRRGLSTDLALTLEKLSPRNSVT